MATWLETETKSLLQRSPPELLAAPDTIAFTLVLLAISGDEKQRLVSAVQRVRGASRADAERIVSRPPPIALKTGLTHVDALLGQYELIACDAVSVFLVDNVALRGAADYLADLYSRLLRSSEVEIVSVEIESLPDGQEARELLDRFFGCSAGQVPMHRKLIRKKARIMAHLAEKIGGRVVVQG